MKSNLPVSVCLLVAVASAGCVERSVQPGPQTHDPTSCASFVAPQEFGLGWEKLNHRISLWSVRPEHGDCLAENLEAAHIGGDFSTGDQIVSDQPFVRFAWQRVDSDVETMGAARFTIKETIGPDHVVTGTKIIDRDYENLRFYPEVVPIIEGLHFDTAVEQLAGYPADYDPAHGYTSRGIGASVEVTSLSDSEIELSYRIRFETGRSLDRSDLNAALEHHRIGTKLDVLLVGLDDAPVHRGSVDYVVAYDRPKTGDDLLSHAPEEKQELSLEGDPDAPTGFYGLSSFELDLEFPPRCTNDTFCPDDDVCGEDGFCELTAGPSGEYLQAMSVGVTLADYDDEEGVARLLVDGYASHTSAFISYYPLENHFTGDVVWIQAGEAGEQRRLEEMFETGSETFSLEHP